MSTLQQAIEANTAAIIALTNALIDNGTIANNTPRAGTDYPIIAPNPTYHEQRAAAAEENLQAEDVKPGMTYEKDVKPFAIKLAAKDKQAFLDLLAERSVKKGSDIDPLHLPEFLARIKRVLGE